MAEKTHTHAPKLAHVYLSVLIILFAGSLLANFFSNNMSTTQVEKQQPIVPPQVSHKVNKSTVLSFSPTSSAAEPIVTRKGNTVTLDIMIDPGQNLVSFIKTDIEYDPSKLEPINKNAFKAEGVLTSLLDGPTYNPGRISVTMSIGADPTKAIAKPTKAATVSFRTIDRTVGSSTNITFSSTTNVLSLASTDNASDNVLSTVVPAIITIN